MKQLDVIKISLNVEPREMLNDNIVLIKEDTKFKYVFITYLLLIGCQGIDPSHDVLRCND